MRRRHRFQWGHGEALRVCTSGRHPRRRTRGKWIRWRKKEDICVASGRIRDGHWDILGLPPPPSSTQTRDWENVEQIYIKIFDTRQPPPSGQQPFRRKYENLGGFISQTKLLLMCVFFLSLSQIIKWFIIKKRSGQVKPRYATTRSTPGRNRNNNRTVTAADEPMVP